MRKVVIREHSKQLRDICMVAINAHRGKFGEYCPTGKVVDYKIRSSGKVNWIQVKSMPKSYVAKVIM